MTAGGKLLRKYRIVLRGEDGKKRTRHVRAESGPDAERQAFAIAVVSLAVALSVQAMGLGTGGRE